VKERYPREQWPRVRTYTVREWDPERGRLTIDFVVHGDEGVAGPWAAGAKPGDVLQLMGPGGGYTPSPDAAWHLMVGDLAAVPAIAASLRRVPAGAPVHVIIAVPGPEDEIALETPGELRLTWLHGDGTGDGLAVAVRDLDFPAGDVHAFVHGEAAVTREIRRHLVLDRGVPRESMSASGYWKAGRDDEAWRAEKADFNRAADAELEAEAA
jgi:NADPH-dependent ferric siderophore reductase